MISNCWHGRLDRVAKAIRYARTVIIIHRIRTWRRIPVAICAFILRARKPFTVSELRVALIVTMVYSFWIHLLDRNGKFCAIGEHQCDYRYVFTYMCMIYEIQCAWERSRNFFLKNVFGSWKNGTFEQLFCNYSWYLETNFEIFRALQSRKYSPSAKRFSPDLQMAPFRGL